jgi:hypothetical protein
MNLVANLHKNILATVTYYDVLDFPLTPYELWRQLISYQETSSTDKAKFKDVFLALATPELQKKLEQKNGFVFLPGRGSLVSERIQREKLSAHKLEKMRNLVGTVAILPFVRMIAATGSLAFKHGKKGSDWDMFIVMQAGKIWIGRIILTSFLHLIGKRRYGKKVQDRACLNYYITDDQLEIMNKDLYGAHEYQTMRLLYGTKTFARFEMANRWISRFKPQYGVTFLQDRFTLKESFWKKNIQAFLEAFVRGIPATSLCVAWQKKKIAKNPNTQLLGSYIEASDQALVFLPHPRGPKVFTEFKKRLSF